MLEPGIFSQVTMRDKVRTARFYCPQLPSRGPAVLPPSEAHHTLHVLRLKVGAEVELFDGRGAVAAGTIAQASRKGVTVSVAQPLKIADRRGPVVHVAFALPKGKRLDWLLEKATELGAASLWPTLFERSVATGGEFTAAKRDRWLGHCIAAAKQCGANHLPDIQPPAPLSDILDRAGESLCVVGDTCEQAGTIPDALCGRQPSRPICLVIGPEGGLTDSEREELQQRSAAVVALGHTTLRVETAALSLLAAVWALCG